MFQLRQLKTFVAAAETLSFTQAGKRVHLSQPAVTEQIRALEQLVGQPLFERRNNVLALTDAGQRLVVHARELLAMADAALQAVRHAPAADPVAISVAAPQTLCASLLIPLLAGCADALPDVRIEVLERNSAATCQLVTEGQAHLGLVHGWPDHDAAVRATLVARDVPVVVLPAGHPLADGERIGADALARFPLLLTAPGCRYRDYADTLLQQASARPQVRAIADSVAALVQMVAAGAGIAVLPRMAVDAQAMEPRVTVRALAGGGEGLPVCALTADRPPAPRIAALVDLLRVAAAGLYEPVPALDVQDGARRVAVAEQV